jgi:arginyl-tRNA synthetase
MTSLAGELSRIAGQAFAAEGLAESFGRIQVADRPDLAQFQCNGALAAAKAAKSNPRAIAEKIAARLKTNSIFSKVEIAGPGFLNLDLADEALDARAASLDPAEGADTGAGKTVVIDFGGPNVAKPMHVGHLRSSIIGDCLQRLYRANGWHVVSDVHLGDWGLQMGQLISEVEIEGTAPIYFDVNYVGPYPDESPVSMDELEILYPRASAACKADPARLEAARRATVDLQAGRPGYRALWQHFVKVSERGLQREFGSLGVNFDLWNGESSVDALIAPMIEDLKARGLAELSEGALVVAVAKDDDKKPLPPLILVKSEGGVLYGTTDLATIIERVREQDPDLILYVVDHRQHGHFEQVFRAAAKASLSGRALLEHVGYGTMNGADGKPFKTRAGGVMKLHDLIAMATAEAQKRLTEQNIGADFPPRSVPRSRARSESRPSSSPTCRTCAPPTTSSTWSDFPPSRARRAHIFSMPPCASSRCCAGLASRLSSSVPPPSTPRKSAGLSCNCCRCRMFWRRRRTSGRPTCCANSLSSWRRISAAFTANTMSCPNRIPACGRPGWVSVPWFWPS